MSDDYWLLDNPTVFWEYYKDDLWYYTPLDKTEKGTMLQVDFPGIGMPSDSFDTFMLELNNAMPDDDHWTCESQAGGVCYSTEPCSSYYGDSAQYNLEAFQFVFYFPEVYSDDDEEGNVAFPFGTVMRQPTDWNGCVLGVSNLGPDADYFILGAQFFQQYYAVFNMWEKNTVLLAKSENAIPGVSLTGSPPMTKRVSSETLALVLTASLLLLSFVIAAVVLTVIKEGCFKRGDGKENLDIEEAYYKQEEEAQKQKAQSEALLASAVQV